MPCVHCRQGTDTLGSFNGTQSLSQSQLLLASPSATSKHRVVYWPRGNWGYEKALVLRTGECWPLPEELRSKADLLKCWTAQDLHSGTAPGQVRKRTWLRTLHRNGRWASWPKVGSSWHHWLCVISYLCAEIKQWNWSVVALFPHATRRCSLPECRASR